ncbi:hypothetical protein CBS147353_1385 [Aspergillus niger]|nr:hypothetical protein CBS147347_903 [Aspergillus niger]KAI3085733.1 hypothetical protein CBS147353_1385 [Aspergillus niger]
MEDEKASFGHIDHAAEEHGLPDLSNDKESITPAPNDPQNWSTAAKLTTYLTICFYTFLANVNSSNFTVATKAIIAEFHVSQTQAGELVCFNVFLFGVGNIFWVPLMRVIGKRPVYLISMLFLSMMNVWSSRATSYGELLASRILSGFAAAAADATVPAVVSDMVAPHERGHYLMIFHLALTGGLFLGPLINAYLVQDENWRWMCYFLAIAVGAVFVVAIFTVRETTYLARHASSQKTRNIVVQLTASRTFTAPPYNWPAGSIGLLSLSGFIGALLAFYLGGRLIDILSTYYTRRRGGQRLPEYRLPAMIIPGTIGPAGILIFGLCVANQTHWAGAAVGYAMQAFGVAAISNVAVTYSLDCYKPITGEALVIIFVIRNTIGRREGVWRDDGDSGGKCIAGGAIVSFGALVYAS